MAERSLNVATPLTAWEERRCPPSAAARRTGKRERDAGIVEGDKAALRIFHQHGDRGDGLAGDGGGGLLLEDQFGRRERGEYLAGDCGRQCTVGGFEGVGAREREGEVVEDGEATLGRGDEGAGDFAVVGGRGEGQRDRGVVVDEIAQGIFNARQ